MINCPYLLGVCLSEVDNHGLSNILSINLKSDADRSLGHNHRDCLLNCSGLTTHGCQDASEI